MNLQVHLKTSAGAAAVACNCCTDSCRGKAGEHDVAVASLGTSGGSIEACAVLVFPVSGTCPLFQVSGPKGYTFSFCQHSVVSCR